MCSQQLTYQRRYWDGIMDGTPGGQSRQRWRKARAILFHGHLLSPGNMETQYLFEDGFKHCIGLVRFTVQQV